MRALVFLLLFGVSTAQATTIINSDRDLEGVSRVKQDFDSVLELHQTRKMGVGMGFGGAMGLAGVQMQLNFALDVGIGLGFGIGRGYEVMNLSMKHLLTSGAFVPYWGLGYTRWNGRGDELEKTSPPVLKKKFLSNKEVATGEFTENLIYPSLGVQLYSTSGEWAGASLYAEVLYLMDVEDFEAGATGGIGLMYFF